MAFSWMVQLLQVHVKSDLPKCFIDIIIPRTQIPMWCNTQNVGSSIRMDPSPSTGDKNLTFVAHDDPNSLGEGINFKSSTSHYDISCLELAADVWQVPGLHFEVKNCGYRWIFEEDLEQLNPQSGNSSVQNMYQTNK
ncbi:hypothetical protein MtrunA17_Chr4g0041741 [Medicago truncatula]|nr:uncharacterized protein LOC11443373 [Medicago truncatula]RHN61910.1 hypothetical protein MtrunA17_Chr4g0041741 [Medicago truncatula]